MSEEKENISAEDRKVDSTEEDNEQAINYSLKVEESPSESSETDVPPEEKSNNQTSEPPTCNPDHVHYEGDLAVYTDPNTRTQYEWASEKDEWVLRNVQYGFEDDTHVYVDKDGVKYFWDKQKSAWFPKLDDDFMARYQMSYGFLEDTQEDSKSQNVDKEEDDTEDEKKNEPKATGEKRKASEPTWFELDDTENTKVYVSNLPTDITEQEFIDLMQKCGLVMRDTISGQFKIKLYKEPGTDYLKGDALCTYIRVESVKLALDLLDGTDFKGHKVRVERAKFELKGQYDPKLKPKTKKRKDKMKMKKMQDKLFDWRPEKFIGDRAKHEKVVVVKNLFDPSIFDTDVKLILEFQEDLREEAAKIGTCKKVILYDRHPEGVAQINMSSPEEADEVVKLLNGRWFMKRQLTAEIWDGKTKFKIAETDAQINERMEKWDNFLEQSSEGKKETDLKNNVNNVGM